MVRKFDTIVLFNKGTEDKPDLINVESKLGLDERVVIKYVELAFTDDGEIDNTCCWIDVEGERFKIKCTYDEMVDIMEGRAKSIKGFKKSKEDGGNK